MSRTILFGLLLCVGCAVPSVAQDGVNLEEPQPSGGDFVPVTVVREPLWSSPQQQEPSMSSDLWLYLHEQRRHDDPQQAVRRKAEFKAMQRQQRLAAMAWYGQSNQRPTATTAPFMGTYSPSWVGATPSRYGWTGNERRILSPFVADGMR